MKLKKYNFTGRGLKGEKVTIGMMGMLYLNAGTSGKYDFKSKGNRVNVFTDEEQENFENEVKVYIVGDKEGALKVSVDPKGARTINLKSLLSEVYPHFRKGNVSHQAVVIDKTEYLEITIPAEKKKAEKKVVDPNKPKRVYQKRTDKETEV